MKRFLSSQEGALYVSQKKKSHIDVPFLSSGQNFPDDVRKSFDCVRGFIKISKYNIQGSLK